MPSVGAVHDGNVDVSDGVWAASLLGRPASAWAFANPSPIVDLQVHVVCPSLAEFVPINDKVELLPNLIASSG